MNYKFLLNAIAYNIFGITPENPFPMKYGTVKVLVLVSGEYFS